MDSTSFSASRPYAVALEDIEVSALETGVGHVDEVCIPEEIVAHTDSRGVRGEADTDARGALRALPKVGAHTVLQRDGDAGVGAERVVPALVYNAELLSVDIFPGLLRFIGSESCHSSHSAEKNKIQNSFHGYINRRLRKYTQKYTR